MQGPGDLSQHQVSTVAETDEVHVYVLFHYPHGVVGLWEIDLVGARMEKASDGKLPPVVHLECPLCSPQHKGADRSFLSITKGNKDFEVEELSRPKWVYYAVDNNGKVYELHHDREKAEQAHAAGLRVCINVRELTVKQPFECDYCHLHFRLLKNHLEHIDNVRSNLTMCSGSKPS